METTALARLAGVPGCSIEPADVRTPADHGALYATQRHFRMADGILHSKAEGEFRSLAGRFELEAESLYGGLHDAGLSVYWVDMSLPEAQGLPVAGPLRTVRAVVPGLLPMAFGEGLLPLGMISTPGSNGLAVHPFS